MKKKLLLILLACLFLSGCSITVTTNPKDKEQETEKEEIANAVWDCVEYDSLEKMNAAAGTNIVSPGAMGVENQWYGVISKTLAQYKYDINGYTWCIRGAKNTSEDISGIHNENLTFEENVDGFFYFDDCYVYRFFNDGYQYVISLTNTDHEFDETLFSDLCLELEFRIKGLEEIENSEPEETISVPDYTVTLHEEGDDLIYEITSYSDSGEKQITRIIYGYENDKMVSIMNEFIFETEESAKAAYEELINGMGATGTEVLEGTKITADNSGQVVNHTETKAELYEMLSAAVTE